MKVQGLIKVLPRSPSYVRIENLMAESVVLQNIMLVAFDFSAQTEIIRTKIISRTRGKVGSVFQSNEKR